MNSEKPNKHNYKLNQTLAALVSKSENQCYTTNKLAW